MMLGDGLDGEWDSSLEMDQTLEQIDRAELTRLFHEFSAQYSQINDTNQKIIFKQFFSLQNKVNADLLESCYASKLPIKQEPVESTVQLKDLLAVAEPFKLQSPLPLL
jgi:hypothetical protein